jgi:hypothetical protein
MAKIQTPEQLQVAADAAKALKSFKMSPEVEDLYRYVHENKLRDETDYLFNKSLDGLGLRKPKRKARAKKKKAKKLQ